MFVRMTMVVIVPVLAFMPIMTFPVLLLMPVPVLAFMPIMTFPVLLLMPVPVPVLVLVLVFPVLVTVVSISVFMALSLPLFRQLLGSSNSAAQIILVIGFAHPAVALGRT